MSRTQLDINTRERRQCAIDFWAEGHIVRFDSGPERTETRGDFSVLYLGADVVVTPAFLIGALVQFDHSDTTTRALQTSTSGHGWLVGPYATLRLSENIFGNVRAAWGESDNKVSPTMTFTDDFDTTRWLVEGSL